MDLRYDARRHLLIPEHGPSIKLEKRGEGTFSKVYSVPGDESRVVIFTPHGVWDKEATADAYFDSEGTNPHVPACVKLGELEEWNAYAMPRYTMPLRAKFSHAWDQYRQLEECARRARNLIFDKYGWQRQPPDAHGYERSWEILQCARGESDYETYLPDTLVEALDLMIGAATNYGSQMGIEFSPRNLGTDAKGNLVLVDLIFDVEIMGRRTDRRWKKPRGLR